MSIMWDSLGAQKKWNATSTDGINRCQFQGYFPPRRIVIDTRTQSDNAIDTIDLIDTSDDDDNDNCNDNNIVNIGGIPPSSKLSMLSYVYSFESLNRKCYIIISNTVSNEPEKNMHSIMERLVFFDPINRWYRIHGVEPISRPKIFTFDHISHYVVDARESKLSNVNISTRLIEEKFKDEKIQIFAGSNHNAKSLSREIRDSMNNSREVKSLCEVMFVDIGRDETFEDEATERKR